MPVIFILTGAGSIGFLTLFFIELQRDGKRGSRVEVTRVHTPMEDKPAQESKASSQVGSEGESKRESVVPIDGWVTSELQTWTQAR